MPFFSGGSDPGTAQRQLGTDNAAASTFGNQAGSSWNALFPSLQQNAMNPQGLSPQEKATMNTASSQSLGGSQAGAVGQGNLMAGRTHNPASAGAALDASAQKAGAQQSQNALGVEEFSTNLAQQKQQTALKELGSLFGTNVQGLNEALSNANNALGTYEKAKASQGSVMGDLTQLANLGGAVAGDVTGVSGMMPKSSGGFLPSDAGGWGDVGSGNG
jgi:hypothetical protein